ncbi:MAG TPA: hypothetical protein VFS52_22980 [Steroidobacteraceae bacterium]|jgi:hypothetical protein|nr:hypothetical protein [Steroidobacteraceae bacterium]
MPVHVRRGLRKLEFAPATDARAARDARDEALVEFVTEAPLAVGTTACVPLGRRNGELREVVGIAQLVESKDLGAHRREYRYRIRGAVTKVGTS